MKNLDEFKNKKLIIISIILLNLFPTYFFAFGMNPIQGELLIENHSGVLVRVAVYPIGTIYNNFSTTEKHYNFKAAETGPTRYIVGGLKDLPDENIFWIAFDRLGISGSDAVIGYGRYRVSFLLPSEDGGYTLVNYVDVDYSDKNYPVGYDGDYTTDLGIKYYGTNNIKYQFHYEEMSIPQTKLVEVWDQRTPTHTTLLKTQNKGPFLSVPSTEQNWRNYPILATGYGGLAHLNPGSLFTELNIQANVICTLTTNSTMTVEKCATLKVLQNATLRFNTNCTLYVKRGGRFFNYGSLTGTPVIVFERNSIIPICMSEVDGSFTNTKLILEDSAAVDIPDSTVLNLDSNSKLIMGPSSTIRFGKNSKIELKNGSRIFANNCKFKSIDTTQTWDGIYLSGISYDTLKNCVIENAYNGINIEDKISLYDPVATEISGCTFQNTTTTDLLNYVYVNNSTNVLIKGCNSAASSSGKFTSGIIAEYCPSNGVVIADNNINYVTTGLNIVQSSLYIGRNTITGSTNSGTGIYLDNSNGTIEYNIVNNFQKSFLAYYSSPYLLKNTFSGASSKNIDLTSNSSPVMKPVVSGSTLRWLGGNNSITGTPSVCGISFTDCYPLLDSGYNRVIVNGADYLNGVFTFQYTTVPARLNWWYDDPPQSSLFDITGGDVTYSPTFDGSSVPATDGSELNSLGWGLYDTVFTKSLGDNPTPEDIFMQAYTKEMHSEYAEAINLYKQVVSEYRSSSYAPVSLARIFNCLEKNNSSIPVYQSIQGYYINIHGDTTYPQESRELSEDFAIKSKVRQGLIESAIIDYDNIYSHNQNNSKGHHALINKLCLMNMAQGGDNPFGGNSSNVKHKYELLSLIIGKNIEPKTSGVTETIPKHFKLYQNYPNPFNPVTTIKYDIPKDGNVQIKIYDITGREVFAINEYKQAGSYEVRFDGTNYSSGLYLYRVEVVETTRRVVFTETKKMVLIK